MSELATSGKFHAIPHGAHRYGGQESGKGCCRVAMAMPQHCGAEGRFSPAHSYDGMDFFLPNRN